MSSADYVPLGAILVHKALYTTVENDILPGSGLTSKQFWTGLEKIVVDFTPRNEALLRRRDALQAQIDAYLCERRGQSWDAGAYTAFLTQIGYIAPADSTPFVIETQNTDVELRTPGPQLVVPVDNARYALNAANARWGSLLDAYYGTDAGPAETDGAEKGKSYNPKRGQKVFEYSYVFLNKHFPLAGGASFADVVGVKVIEGGSNSASRLVFKLKSGRETSLDQDSLFVGHVANTGKSLEPPLAVVLKHNHLHVELVFDKTKETGKGHPAGLSDVLLESAVTAICDFEDSVAAVDAEDKAKVYRNWAGLMKATLTEKLTATQTRSLRGDKSYTTRNGSHGVLKGRALLFVRNVGIHMYTDAIKLAHNDAQVPEGIVDAMVSALASRHDIFGSTNPSKKGLMNSTTGSMYMVKPKMHGPQEVAFVVELLGRVEAALSLPLETIKLGIMDEERRTTANLRECIRAAKRRCVFINTGFLDRTGDEIHTSFAYGPMLPKKEIENATWRLAYEDWNVDIGVETALARCGQTGKGMWAAPNAMADMLKKKGAHPASGATTAWVPSPTAATLHATHYHENDVFAAQARIAQGGRPKAKLSDILLPPFLTRTLTKDEITKELENNAQGILGYVSRWIQLGVGCSTVPDVNDVGLMEDRATLRISSQHIANWLEHGVVSKAQVLEAFEKMAHVVDRQNKGSAGYAPMAQNTAASRGFQCALQLVFRGKAEANGLTENTLTEFRRAEKAAMKTAKL